MLLTLREAAAILGVPVRTLRARVARGELPATRDGRQWRVDRRELPLTEAQRQVLHARADEVRQAVDAILPSRLATTRDRRARSLLDLDAWREAAAVHQALRDLPEAPGRDTAATLLESACGWLAEATFVYERERKLAALGEARAAIGRAVSTLLLHQGVPPPAPYLDLVVRLEATVSPAVGGYARWVASLPGRGGGGR